MEDILTAHPATPSRADQIAALEALLRVQQSAHADDPSIADARLGALAYVAIRTATFDAKGLPNVKDVAEAMDLTRGGASRVLSNLAPHGRGRAEERVRAKLEGGSGLGLVISNPDPRDRRAEAFTLTVRGQERVGGLLSAFTGANIKRFVTLNYDEWLRRFLEHNAESSE